MEAKKIHATPKYYGEEDILKAFYDGKLFIEVEVIRPSHEDLEAELLDYVSPLIEFCNAPYKDFITNIWCEILHNDAFDLTMCKGPRRGSLNRYKVMALVTYLCNKKVYGGTPLKLYYKLENTTKKGPVYTNSGLPSYAVTDHQRPILNGIIKKKY